MNWSLLLGISTLSVEFFFILTTSPENKILNLKNGNVGNCNWPMRPRIEYGWEIEGQKISD